MADPKATASEGSDTAEIFDIIGATGLAQQGGIVRDEFLYQLRGKKGRETYREMSDNDPTIGAILFLFDVLIQQVEWFAQPAPVEGQEELALEAAVFLEYERTHMKSKWADVISDANTSFPYGWSLLETVYRRREDGKVGWFKMEGRAQESLEKWEFDENEELVGMWQRVEGDPDSKLIPIAKALHFRTKNNKGNPEGRSILRNAYRPWYFLKRIQEIEAIGIERDLAGFPVLQVPKALMMKGAKASEKAILADLIKMVSRVKRDEQEGMVIPNELEGFKFELLASSGKRQFDTNVTIRRYQVDILMSVLAEVLMLGMDKVGSNALASSKTGTLALAIKAYLVRMRDVFNAAKDQLFELNPQFPPEVWPTFEHGDVETIDLESFAKAVAGMVGAGVIVPDNEIEKRVRSLFGLPPPQEDDLEDHDDKRPPPKKKAEPDDEDMDDPDDPADVVDE